MHPSQHISLRIQNLATLLYKIFDQVLQSRLGIGMSQFKILSTVKDNPRLLQNHIASALNQTEASISRQVKLLHKKKLLITQINPKDKRQHVTTLTTSGQRIINEAMVILEAIESRSIVGLSKNQQFELLNALDIIEQHAPSNTL